MKKDTKKPAAKPKKATKKVTKKVTEASSPTKDAYRKAIDLIVRVNELLVDDMDDQSIDALLDRVAVQRKLLEGSKRNEVIGRLLKSLSVITTVEIDEAADTD